VNNNLKFLSAYMISEDFEYIQYCAKVLGMSVFSPPKKGFKPVIYIFCCRVSVGNISSHFQTFILPLILIIQWYFCMHKESDNSRCSTLRSDLHIIKSVCDYMKKQMKLRHTKSRRTVAVSPRRLKKPSCKATWKTTCKCTWTNAGLNAKGDHIKYWFDLVNRS